MMNDQQKKCFKMAYDFIHDERQSCRNLADLIDITFPARDSAASRILRDYIMLYLDVRANQGGEAMEIVYSLNEAITAETIKAAV